MADGAVKVDGRESVSVSSYKKIDKIVFVDEGGDYEVSLMAFDNSGNA